MHGPMRGCASACAYAFMHVLAHVNARARPCTPCAHMRMCAHSGAHAEAGASQGVHHACLHSSRAHER
eukprot:10185493-Alexandrium_andersonii.AAC.1